MRIGDLIALNAESSRGAVADQVRAWQPQVAYVGEHRDDRL